MSILFLISALLQTATLELGGETLEVEIADTPKLRAQGLMFREEIPEGTGMLFVYDSPSHLAFWMKNTSIPLSIAFFDAKKTLIQIEEMSPSKNGSLRLYESAQPAQYALEVPEGWFQRHKIALGAKFAFREKSSRLE